MFRLMPFALAMLGLPLSLIAGPVPEGPYARAVLDSKPLAYFRMSETSGPAAVDASGNISSASYEDGVAFFLEGPQSPAFCGEGIVHRSAQFSGGRMSAVIPALQNARAGYSIELWFWNDLADDARATTGYLLGRPTGDNSAGTGDSLGIGGVEPQAGVDAKGRLIFFGGGSKPVLVGRSVIEPHTWNHLVLVRQSGLVTVYLNGGGEPEIVGETDPLPTKASAQIYIGGRSDKAFSFSGRIDEAAVYDRALQRPEVVAHFHAANFSIAPTSQPVVAHSNITPTAPTPPEDSVARMKLRDGYVAELMAAEPLIVSPVAMAFGPDGKLWVIEMTEYPLGKHGTMDPSGRVVFLESTHNDGKYDKSTVFAENLNFPNGILPWRKGVIVTAAPDVLYLEDTTGSGKADKKEVLYTGFTQGNPQLRVNTPTYGLDNWVYLANGLSSRDVARSTRTGASIETSGHDIRIRPDEGAIEPETGISQYGRKMDAWGNWFGVHNSYPVRSFIIPDRYANRNKVVQLPRGYDDAGLPPNPKVYPVSKGTKRYGYAFFEQSGHFTSACQMTPYRDNLLFPFNPASGVDHVFVCEPAHNLVQHLLLKPSGPAFLAERAAGEEFNEFLASEDDWSRPCFLSCGPDGALWMVDIYRFFIDHPDFLPPEGKQDMRPYYRLGDEMGRIYRVYPKGSQPRSIPRLDKLDTAHLVAALDSPSGWQRDMAQMMLVWQKDPAAVAPLEELVKESANPLARMHAICTLDGIGQLQPALIERALRDANPAVRRQAVRLCEQYSKESHQLVDAAAQLADDPEPIVKLQLAFTLGEWDSPVAGMALAKIALAAGDDVYLSAAIISSATNHYAVIADALISANKASPLTHDLLAMALANNNRDLAARLLAPVFTPHNGTYDTEQLEAFAQFMDGLAQHHTTPTKLAAAKADSLAQRLGQSASLFAAARDIAPQSNQPTDHRVAATALLGRDESHTDDDLKLLAGLLAPGSPSPLQTAAVRSLTRINRDDVPAILLRDWKADPPEVRNAVLDALLGREPWSYELLKKIDAYEFAAGNIDPSRRQRLIHSTSPRVRELADKCVGASSVLSRDKVLEDYRIVHELPGDAARGQKVFANNCVTCHHLANMGHEIGPNLQSVAAWPVDALMVAILDPSRSAEPRYLSYNCVLDTGETVYGLLVRESAAGVVMKGIDAIDREVPRRQIKSLECTNRSLMPDGLEANIDKQGLADLIRFLQTQGQRDK